MIIRLQLEIAEIIDPPAFAPSRRIDILTPSMSEKSALAKADAILTLLKQSGVIVMVEDDSTR
jgi:hypothetical protein